MNPAERVSSGPRGPVSDVYRISGRRGGVARSLVLLSLALVFAVRPATGQATDRSQISFGGLFFGDYAYVFSSPNEQLEGDNGFEYRRLYLTADVMLSERFDGRFRLEARQSSTNEDGRPSPFVQDAWVRWNDFLGDDHRLTMGVFMPPSFDVAQERWQYRSLARTVMHRNGIVDSRDTGVKLAGPLSGDRRITYALMVANNSGVANETDRQKRVYGQIGHQSDDGAHTATLGADYAALPNGHSTTVSVFSGTGLGRGGFGLEVFANVRSLDDVEDDITWFGGSAWVLVPTGERNRFIGRVDLTSVGTSGSRAERAFVLVGYSISPEDGVEVIPNVVIEDEPGNVPAAVTGRMTLYVRF